MALVGVIIGGGMHAWAIFPKFFVRVVDCERRGFGIICVVMFESFAVVARQVLILFLLMGVGAACHRLKILSRETVKGLTELLVLIITPTLIVHVFQRPFDRALLAGLGWAVAASFAAHAIGSALAFACLRRGGVSQRGVLRFAVIFSNAGFMGLPLEYALLGPRGVFFGAVYVVMFNLVCWSWGIMVMRGEMRGASARALFVNPGTVGVALGLPFFLFSIKMPEMLAVPVGMIADLNTPLAMIMTGWYLADADFGPVLRCFDAYTAGFLRLAAVPAAVVGLMWALRSAGFELDATMCAATSTAAAAPVGALTTVVAARLGKDVSMATGLVSGTTLVSMLTMPPVVGFALWLFAAR